MTHDRDDIIINETVARVAEVLGPALEELTVERVVLGLFFSGVELSDGHGGLCFTPVKEIPEAVCCPTSAKAMPGSGHLRGRSARDFLDDIARGNVLKRALGIAVLNALSATCWARNGGQAYEVEFGRDAFDEVEIDPQKRTVVIGALVPMVKRLMAAGVDLTILEMDAATLKPAELAHFVPAERWPEVVPEADLLVITGTTLLNGTLPGLLSAVKPGAEVLVTGPTASMLPEAFFSRGVTMLGGIVVTEPGRLLDVISEGGSGYHFFGKSAERLVIKKPA